MGDESCERRGVAMIMKIVIIFIYFKLGSLK